MRSLRQVPAGLPYERGGQQGIPQAEKWDGVYPLLRMYESLSHKGAALVHVLSNSIARGYLPLALSMLRASSKQKVY